MRLEITAFLSHQLRRPTNTTNTIILRRLYASFVSTGNYTRVFVITTLSSLFGILVSMDRSNVSVVVVESVCLDMPIFYCCYQLQLNI